MRFQVIILGRARSDVESIYEWFSKRSPFGAVAWYAAFWDATQKLRTDPESCGMAPEAEIVGIPLRQSIFRTRRGKRYRILLTVIGNEVRLLRVRGPGQAPLKPEDLGTA
jgi:plasmid stabilization system protein ParE